MLGVLHQIQLPVIHKEEEEEFEKKSLWLPPLTVLPYCTLEG
jgi:hypothetical protein